MIYDTLGLSASTHFSFFILLFIECQGIELNNNNSDNKLAVKPYDTRTNDVWSLGVILINLVSGRNPWKQANLNDSAFAAYVKQPRRFFRTILPSISKSLDRILIRIFCLDPTKRITLSELRNMILGCRSFTTSAKTPTVDTSDTNKPMTPQSSQEIQCSKSFESTVMAYIGDYIDDIESSFDSTGEIYKNRRARNKTYSNTSSVETVDNDPPTPRNGSPLFNRLQYPATTKQQNYYIMNNRNNNPKTLLMNYNTTYF